MTCTSNNRRQPRCLFYWLVTILPSSVSDTLRGWFDGRCQHPMQSLGFYLLRRWRRPLTTACFATRHNSSDQRWSVRPPFADRVAALVSAQAPPGSGDSRFYRLTSASNRLQRTDWHLVNGNRLTKYEEFRVVKHFVRFAARLIRRLSSALAVAPRSIARRTQSDLLRSKRPRNHLVGTVNEVAFHSFFEGKIDAICAATAVKNSPSFQPLNSRSSRLGSHRRWRNRGDPVVAS